MTASVNPYFGDPVVFWSLRLLLFISLLITGYIISYGKNSLRKYWQISLPVMVLYTFIEGLRYMRGWDYPHYMYDLTTGLYADYSEPVYLLWVNTFRAYQIPFIYGFLFYSAILVFGFFLLLKNFHKAAFWACPLFLVIPNQSTNLIRMFFAMAFLLIGIHFLLNKKKKSIIYFSLSCMIHFSVIPVVLLVLLFAWSRIELLLNNVYVVLAAFIAIALFWDISRFDELVFILNRMDSTGFKQGDIYLNNAEMWFGSEGSIQVKYGFKNAGLLMSTLNICVPAYIIFYGYKAYKSCSKMKIIFNCSVFGFFVQQLAGGIELFSRYYHWVTCLIPILIGIIWIVVPMKRLEKIAFAFIIFFYYYIANFLYYIFVPLSTGYGFIWDR